MASNNKPPQLRGDIFKTLDLLDKNMSKCRACSLNVAHVGRLVAQAADRESQNESMELFCL
jgi:hypothetical protein